MRKIVCIAGLLICHFIAAADPGYTISASGATSFCQGGNITLTATGAPAGASFQWTKNNTNIGGATTSTFTITNAAVTASGTYSVVVDTGNGGLPIHYDTINIVVNAKPAASFTFSPNNICISTPVSFTNTSSGATSYSWNFADPNSGTSNTSTAQHPTHRFVGTPGITPQTFNVTLTVTSSAGCTATFSSSVTINQSPGTQLGGPEYDGGNVFKSCGTSATIFTFINQSSTLGTNTSYKIIWGDASPDFTTTSNTNWSTTHSFGVGSHPIQFIVAGAGGCIDTTTYFVFVGTNPAVGLGNPGNTSICTGDSLTFPISSTASNSPGTVYTITFNDGYSVSYTHPPSPGSPPSSVTHLFTTTSCGTTSNGFSNSFSATIVASNPCGTSQGSVVPIYVSSKPQASMTLSPRDTVCVNSTVTVSSTSPVNNSVNPSNGSCTPGKNVWVITPSTGFSVTSGSTGNTFGFTNPNAWTNGTSGLTLNFTSPGTYTIKLYTGNSSVCKIDSVERTICVNPQPTSAFLIDNNAGCTPVNVNTTNNSNTPICGVNTYTWTVGYSNAQGCTPNSSNYTITSGTLTSFQPSFQFINPGVYTINLVTRNSSGACVSPVTTQQVTVKSKPVVSIAAVGPICQNQSITPVATVNNCYSSVAATYSWTFQNGTPASSTSLNPGPISFTNPNTNNITLDVTNECGVTQAVTTIQVNPRPDISTPANQTHCPGTVVPSQNFIGSLAGTTYSWSNSNTAIGLGASGNNSNTIPSFTATNATASPITATITLNATKSGCTTTTTFTITVNPSPTVTQPANQAVCNNASTSAVNFGGSAVAGTVYAWTNSNTSTGLAASGTGSIPSFTATNAGNAPLTATVTVTPQYTNNTVTCSGTPKAFSITVNPTPSVTQPADATFCNGNTTTAISFTGSAVSGTTYNWTNSNTAIGLAQASGSGNIPSFTATNAGSNPINSTITVTPVSNGCPGTPQSFTITINPAAIVQFSPVANQTICSGALTNAVTVSSPTAGATVAWTSTPPAGITGAATSGTTSIPAQTLTNNTNAPITVNYIATASTSNGAGSCTGSQFTYSIVVNPIPVVANANVSACSGAAFTLSPGGVPAGTTYSWSVPVVTGGLSGGASGTNQSSVTGTLTNPTNVSQTATYTVTPTSGSCPGNDFTVVVTVNPKPVIGNMTATICSEGSFSLTPVNGTPASTIVPSGTTYSWSAPVATGGMTGSAASNQTSIGATLSNPTNTTQTATYTVTPVSGATGACAGATFTVTVTVDAKPTIANKVLSICSGAGFTLTPANTSPDVVPAGTTYSWSAPTVTGGITGGTAGTDQASISGTLTNPTNASQTATYTITPKSGNCTGTPFTLTVTVNPQPGISDQNATICSGTLFNITPAGAPAGTTYSWGAPVVTGGITGGAAGTNQSSVTGTLTNPTITPQTATYTVTPNLGSCSGASFTVVITLNPNATVTNTPLNQTICSNTATSAVAFTSSTAAANTVFNWTGSTANGITGFTASGSGGLAAMTLVNPNNTQGSVVYTVTPTYTNNSVSCAGTPATYIIFVNPTPTVTATPASQIICSGIATAIALTSNVSGTTFAWTVSSNINVTGAAAGSGNTIAQTLSNSSTSDQTITYTITPTYTNSAGCAGTPITVDITVKPTPDVTITPGPQTICSGTSSAAVTLSSVVSGAVFDWTASVPAGITGVTPSSATNTTTIPAMTLVNATNAPLTVTFTITPKTSGGGACSGSNVTYTITVNPAPNVTFNPTAETICSGSTTTAVTLSSSTTGATFSWTANANGATGVTASGTGNIPTQTITNSTNAPISVVYTATASTSGATACPGTPTNYTVVVNPVPNVVAAPISQTICSNTSTSIALSSTVSGTTFSWTISSNGNITGAANGSGTTISQTLINTSTTPQDITYTIKPTYTNAGRSCDGNTITVTITVNPNATVTNSPLNQTICSNAATSAVSFTSSTAAVNTVFNWTGSTANGITGFTASGSGGLGVMTLGNPNNTQGSVAYIVTPTYTNNSVACAGTPATYTFFVNPTPNVILPAAQTICSGSTSNNVTLNSNVSGTLFNWTAVPSSSGVTGFTASATNVNNIAPQTISNSTSTAANVTYTVTPIANGCPGAPSNYVITINPTPGITLPPNQTICSGASTTLVTLTSDVGGASFNWTATPSSGSISGFTPAGSNVTTIPVQTIFNNGIAPGNVVYSITPITGGSTSCPGTAVPYTITINPSPVVDFSIADQTICSGSVSAAVNITSTTPNAVISWTSNANGVGGVTATGSNTIPAQTLINNTNAPITVTYTASATTNDAAACPGPIKVYRITVNPVPNVVATPPSESICTNTATNIALSSNVPAATFSWTVAVTGVLTGATNGTGNTIAQTLVNNGVNPGTATYSIAPHYLNNGTTCTGNPVNVVVTVNPVASITNNPLSQTICTNNATAPVTWTSFTAGTTYAWTASSANGITGFPASGTGNLPAMTLINTNNAQGSVTILVTSTANLCSGPPTPYVITVNPDAKAAITVIQDSGCAPFVIDNVNGVKPVLYPLQNSGYNWYANNAFYGNSPNANPGYTLVNGGDSVTIKMVAVSLYGCKNDSVEHKFYTVPTPKTAFTANDTVGCGPLSVSFLNTTPDLNWFTYFWDFGNGQTFTGAQPGTRIFQPNPTYGDTTYNVILTAFTRCDTVQFTRMIRVRSKPKALFTPDKTYGCSPMTVDFVNTSKGLNMTYRWEFGDGTFFNTSNNSNVQHTYHAGQQDTFHVKLIATNECGSDTATYAIVVAARTINLNFTVNGNEITGCSPHLVRFINNSTGATNFNWDFGDGNIRSTTKNIDTVIHTYSAIGTFVATVRASNGCTDTTGTITIKVFRKPLPDFTINPLPACIGDTLQFTNQTDTATSLLWNFGNGITSQLTNPQYAYTTPNSYDVKLIAVRQYGPGNVCSDSITKTITVVASLPGVFSVSDSVSSCVPFTVVFSNHSLPSSLTTWNFGDGGVDTGNIVSHTFTSVGVYNVVMNARDLGGCKYIANKQITVNGPAGAFIYDHGYICGNTPVRFEATVTGTDSIRWNFGDGATLTSTSNVVYHVYNNPGSYIPTARLLAGAGCNKLLQGTDTIKVDYVDAGFKSNAAKVCGYTNVSFTDTSRAYFGLQSWQWNFGDGNTSGLRNPLHTYTSTNTWPVQLIVTGVSGCADTANIPVFVKVDSKPVATIDAPPTGCVNQPVLYTAIVTSSDPVTYYSWVFSNGATGNTPTVNNNYAAAGIFNATLIAGTSFGCYDTTNKSITINPSPFVTTNVDMQICRGQSAQLNATGGLNYQWAPFTGLSCNTCFNPIATPLTTTQYVVTGFNSYGCAGRDTILITVPQPIDVIATASTVMCIGDSLQLNATGAATYIWSPATGLSCTTCPAPVAKPTVTTVYRVIGKDAYNCFQDTAYVTVGVGNYPVVNVGPDKILATGTEYPLTPSVTNGPIALWTWTPSNDLSCANCPSPVVTAKKDICYTVTATNFFGCSGKDTMCIKVFCESSQLFIPNAFTPDGDGINDLLVVRAKGVKLVKSFRIFNRWGQVVFEKANFQPNTDSYGWNGKVSGIAAPPDVYVYTCEVICEDDTPYTYKGNVAIIK